MALILKNSLLKLLGSNNLTHIRTYARWSHRRPRRILVSEESNEIKSEQLIEEISPPKYKPPQQQLLKPNSIPFLRTKENENKPNNKEKPVTKRKVIKTPLSKETVDMLETVIGPDGNVIYTKLKNNDSFVSQLLLTAKSRRQQIKQDLALLEGKRLIKDALEANCILKHLIFSRKSDLELLKPYLPKSGARILKIPYREIQMWSDLKTTPGIMGIFKTPDVENYVTQNSLPITVICDNVREPGNLGAILRTVAGAGVQSIMLTKGCVDLWDTKVLRSACGAHFHIKICNKVTWPDIKQQLEALKSGVFVADNKIVTGSNANIEEKKSLKEIVSSLPLFPYFGVQYSSYKSLVLIVGGETEGISEESLETASSFGGMRLNIPMNNSVESLNVSVALGVILFEMKRQMLQNNT